MQTLVAAKGMELLTIAQHCGLVPEIIQQFYQWFADTDKVVTVFSQGINQSSTGVFSLTGQPNAMGGREVGGLANQLAAHMELDNLAHRNRVQTFWQSPTVAKQQGLKAVDLFSAIEQGKIKALWIMATNPAVSLPDSQH